MNQHKDFVEDYRRTWEHVMKVGEVASLTRSLSPQLCWGD
jgi:hypothetical protein